MRNYKDTILEIFVTAALVGVCIILGFLGRKLPHPDLVIASFFFAAAIVSFGIGVARVRQAYEADRRFLDSLKVYANTKKIKEILGEVERLQVEREEFPDVDVVKNAAAIWLLKATANALEEEIRNFSEEEE